MNHSNHLQKLRNYAFSVLFAVFSTVKKGATWFLINTSLNLFKTRSNDIENEKNTPSIKIYCSFIIYCLTIFLTKQNTPIRLYVGKGKKGDFELLLLFPQSE